MSTPSTSIPVLLSDSADSAATDAAVAPSTALEDPPAPGQAAPSAHHTSTPGSGAPAAEERDGIGALETERGNLPLESLEVAIATTGLAVRTELTQGFRNPYDEPLEATYIFPLPPRSAVTSMVLRAADRTVEGELKERETARVDYANAVSEGKRASIAEEERPGVFTMRVGNILPGEAVSVTLTLAGMMPYEDGEATVRFPLVVAPRYIPGAPLGNGDVGDGVVPDTDAVPDASRITPPVLLPGFPNPVRLSLTVDVDPAGLPIARAVSSLHPVETEERDGHLHLRVHPGERADRDFLLRLHTSPDEEIASALTVLPDSRSAGPHNAVRSNPAEDGGTFALTLLPPRLTAPPVGRDLVFVLDRSGSMRGWKMVAARRAAARIIDSLTPRDRFSVLTFDNEIETPSDLPEGLVEATDRHRFRAVEHLARTDARGGTEMLRPLLRATDLLANASTAEDASDATAGPQDRERVLVLVTDGQVGNEDQILGELSGRLGGFRVHTVGIDRAVNEAFLGRLSLMGGGHPELVESEDRLDAAMDAIHRRIGTPVLTDIELRPEGFEVDTDALAPAILPALYAGTAVTVYGRYRGSAEGGAIRVLGRSGGRPRAERVTARVADNAALPAVWARARLRDLEDRYVSMRGVRSDELESLEQRITEVSLTYGVLCRFTAYVAVDSRVVTDGGTPRRVTQPVDLPQGWERPPEASTAARSAAPDAAAGGSMPGMAAFGTAGPVSRSSAPGDGPRGQARAQARVESFRSNRTKASRAGNVDERPASPRGTATDRPSPGEGSSQAGDLPPEEHRLPEARGQASALLSAMSSVAPEDRAQWLAGATSALRELAEALAGTPEEAVVRELCRAVDAQAGPAATDPYGTERLWLRVLDVLGALAGASAGSGNAPEPASGAPPASDKGRRRGIAFWRRSSG